MGRLFFEQSLQRGHLRGDGRSARGSFGFDVEALRHEEYDMALGNGGLGRLAACFRCCSDSIVFPY
ncbi:MAG: glycogen/starch/alpha-glucan phosphorylase [Chthoniobacteraceae bacterium]